MAPPSVCTEVEWAWLEERYPSTPLRELMDAFEAEFGRRPRETTVAAHMSAAGIGRERGFMRWTPEADAFLRAVVPGRGEREVAALFEERFGVALTRNQVKNAKHRLGLKSGTHGGRFEKGHIPANKGASWDEQGRPEASRAASLASCFKPGEVRNLRPGWIKGIGHERVDRRGYTWVKVRDSLADGPQPNVPGSFNCNYRQKHHLVWERAHGEPVPEGHVVAFADGDKGNFDPANLVAVPRGLWATIHRNGTPYWDAESLEAAANMARLASARRRAMDRSRGERRGGKEAVE